jgi:type II secretory pathway component GspD/PulD (secretin)
MKKHLISSSIASLIISFCFVLPAFGQTDPPSQPITLHVKDVTLLDVLNKLSSNYRIPIGLQYSTDNTNANLTIDVARATLVEVLDLIVKQEPMYRWEVRDGVINFVPVQNQDEFFDKFLNTRVRRFAPEQGINKFEVRNRLADLPEVLNLLEANKIRIMRLSDYPYSTKSIYSNDQVDFAISDTDVRGVLNKTVRDGEYKLWVLGWWNEKKDTISISF